MSTVAFAIKLADGGPALFRQTRVGMDGRAFTVYKFRTMVLDAEERKAQLAEHDEGNGFNWSGMSGDLAEAAKQGFSLRKALGDDLAWICAHADAVVMLPGWEKSLGATAEVATAKALGLLAQELNDFTEES